VVAAPGAQSTAEVQQLPVTSGKDSSSPLEGLEEQRKQPTAAEGPAASSDDAAAPENMQKLAEEQSLSAGPASLLVESTTEMLASDVYEGAQEDPYGGAEEDPYGGAREDPYGAGSPGAPEVFESDPGTAHQLAADAQAVIDPNITDPLVVAWQGAAKTPWVSPPSLELDPELARPTPPHKQRARRKRRNMRAKQKAASEAATPTEPVVANVGADAGSAQTEVLQMPLWSRISEWTALASLELEESLRRLPEKVKSAEYGRRMALRSELRAEAQEMEEETPSNPADPPELDNMMRKESFLLSIGHNPRQGIRMVDWYAPPRLALPQDVHRDPAAYVGTERMRRMSARQEQGNGGAAPALQVFNQLNPALTMPAPVQAALPAPAPALALPTATATKASSPGLPAATPSLLSQLAAQAAGLAQMQAMPAATMPILPPPPSADVFQLSILGTASKAAPPRPPAAAAAGFAAPSWTAPAAVPPLAGDPLAASSVAGGTYPQPGMQAPVSYNDKLLAFMTKLETTTTPTDAAVREFWLQLPAEDRKRFSTEFPQFMHYVTGQRQAETQQAVQAVEPKTLRVDGLLPVVTADELAGRFGQFGQVLNVSIRKRHGAVQRHVGFVQFARREDADKACQALDNAIFSGVEVRVTERVLGAEASQQQTQAPSLMDAAELKRRKQDAWAAKLTFHQAVLRVDMRSMHLTDDELAEWCTWVPALLRPLVQHSKDPVTNADMNFSDNMITDHGATLLTKLLQEHSLHCARVNLDGNRLTDQALCTWGDFIGQFSLPLQELRMERNAVKGSDGIVQLARCVKLHQGYPVYRSDVQRYTPFVLYLANNHIEHSASVTKLITDACGNRPCLLEEQGFWEVKHQCPAIQLPSFTEQQVGPAGAQHWGTGDAIQQRAIRPRHAGWTSALLPHN